MTKRLLLPRHAIAVIERVETDVARIVRQLEPVAENNGELSEMTKTQVALRASRAKSAALDILNAVETLAVPKP